MAPSSQRAELIYNEQGLRVFAGFGLSHISADEFAHLHELCFEHSWSSQDFKTLCALNTSLTVALYNQKLDLLGFILYQVVLDEAEILTFCVNPEMKKNGYGKLLVEKSLIQLKYHSINLVFLEVSTNNAIAINLYEKFDFYVYFKRNDYYGKNHSALLMKKDLIDRDN